MADIRANTLHQLTAYLSQNLSEVVLDNQSLLDAAVEYRNIAQRSCHTQPATAWPVLHHNGCSSHFPGAGWLPVRSQANLSDDGS